MNDEGAASTVTGTMARAMPSAPKQDLLATYLRHHYAAARGGLNLCARAARTHTDPVARRELSSLVADVQEDRTALLTNLEALGVDRHPVAELVLAWGESLGRLRSAGLFHRSPLTDLIELEALSGVIHANVQGWLALRQRAESDSRLNPYQIDHLVRRGREQENRVEELRREAVDAALVAHGTRVH